MKQYTKWMAATVAVAGGLAFVSSTQAQAVTGDATLDNISPTAQYGAWSTAFVSDGASGIEIRGLADYGSGYWAVPTDELQTLNKRDDEATLVMTVNNAVVPPGTAYDPSNPTAPRYWLGIPFILNDNSGPSTYGGYTGEFTSYAATASPGSAVWNGDTVTETVPLDPAMLAAIQAGGDTIYGFNLELDPAVFPSGFEDITFNSLTLTAPAAAPDGSSTLALLGSATAALLSFRRRNK